MVVYYVSLQGLNLVETAMCVCAAARLYAFVLNPSSSPQNGQHSMNLSVLNSQSSPHERHLNFFTPIFCRDVFLGGSVAIEGGGRVSRTRRS